MTIRFLPFGVHILRSPFALFAQSRWLSYVGLLCFVGLLGHVSRTLDANWTANHSLDEVKVAVHQYLPSPSQPADPHVWGCPKMGAKNVLASCQQKN